MWIEDPDGVRIVLVEVPADHPLRRDPRPALPLWRRLVGCITARLTEMQRPSARPVGGMCGSSCGPWSGTAPAALPRMTFVDIAPAGQTAVDAMRASYVADSGYDGPLVTAFAFGDSAALAGELGLLVLHGPKRATAELVRAFAAQGRAVAPSRRPVPRARRRWPAAGDRAHDGRASRPALVGRRPLRAGTKARVTGRGPGGWTRTRGSSAVSARRWA
jgi:hypothetical protein